MKKLTKANDFFLKFRDQNLRHKFSKIEIFIRETVNYEEAKILSGARYLFLFFQSEDIILKKFT